MDIPAEYTCPITQDIMTDPVCDNEGNTYEKQAIMRWLARNRTSPISRLPLRTADLRPNIALKNLISSFNEKNKVSSEVQTMREARLKRFDGSSQPTPTPTPTHSDTPSPPSQEERYITNNYYIPPTSPSRPSPDMQSVRPPDPIVQETLIPVVVVPRESQRTRTLEEFIQWGRVQDPSFNPTPGHIEIMNLRMTAGLVPTKRPFNRELCGMFDSCPLDIVGPRGGRNPYRFSSSDCDCWKCEDKRDYERRCRNQRTSTGQNTRITRPLHSTSSGIRVQNNTSYTLQLFKADNESSESRIFGFNLLPGINRHYDPQKSGSTLTPGIGQIITFSRFRCSRCSHNGNFVNTMCKHNNTSRTQVDRKILPGSQTVNFVDSNKTYVVYSDRVEIV